MSEKTCACPSPNARRCYEIRYPAPIDDFARGEYFTVLDDEGGCECGCHEPEYADEDPPE